MRLLDKGKIHRIIIKKGFFLLETAKLIKKKAKKKISDT
jgi:hypothetical protein